MLSIEYIHKRVRLFRVELSFVMVAVFALLTLFWNILSILKIVK